MSSLELESLQRRATELVSSAEGRPEAARAAALAARLRAGRFSISIVGEFKRGKSTLVNALVGEAVVPMGVLPLTAIRTELAFGAASTVVEHLDGVRRPIERPKVLEYVSETLNPGNIKQVSRVVITGEWDLLAGGVTLIDTPGVGSIYDHNSEEARSALLDSDGAIVVLAADAPLSARERDMLEVLRDRLAPTFFVLNKVDHLNPEELSQVRQFVTRAIEDCLGRPERVFTVNARSALSAGCSGDPDTDSGSEFADLLAELRRFCRDDLIGAMVRGAKRDLSDLGRSLLDSLTVEEAALEMDSGELGRQAKAFEMASQEQSREFIDDRTLLRRHVAELTSAVRSRLDDFARTEPCQYFSALEATANQSSGPRLNERLWGTIQESVRSSLDAFRAVESERTDTDWQAIADEFRRRTEQRVAAVRDAASDFFRIDLPRLEIPAVSSERERFFYLFLHVGSSTALLTSFAARFVPARLARPRALRKAKQELAREFAKHAGRAGWDLAQRLEEASRALERSMQAELEACSEAILQAAERAERRRMDIERERDEKVAESAAQWQLAQDLAQLSQAL